MVVWFHLPTSDCGDEAEETEEEADDAPTSGVTVLVVGDDARKNCEHQRLKEKNSSNHKREDICSRFLKMERADWSFAY